jgi:hypothetical protein
MYDTRVKFQIEKTIHTIVNKLRQCRYRIKTRDDSKRRVLTEEKLDALGAKLEYSLWNFLKRLVQQIGVYSSRFRRVNVNILRSSRIMKTTTGTIYGFWFDLGGFCLWFVDLWACLSNVGLILIQIAQERLYISVVAQKFVYCKIK